MISPDCALGNKQLLYKRKIAFLSSTNVPPEAVGKIASWVDSLSPDECCVMCGVLTNIERQLHLKLINMRIPQILVFSTPMPDLWSTDVLRAAADGLIAIVSTAPAVVQSQPDALYAAYVRNSFMINVADEIVVGTLKSGGKLDRQLKGLDYRILHQ